MTVTTVKTSPAYNVLIGQDLLRDCVKYIGEVMPKCKTLIISDNNVHPIYGETVKKSLQRGGYEVLEYTFTAGEGSKNIDTVLEILEFAASERLTHSDLIIALGGGVCGDIAGFAAAIYLRGIEVVQIPTTLLAAVDSSVGGKTGVNLSVGKNLVGAFKQPKLVLCDIDTFKTLDTETLKDGMCEVIKYACILDKALFTILENEDFSEHTADIVKRCVELKAQVVTQDEFDKSIRQILNFGHTIGHAIEKLSAYRISHGKAIAIGMYIIERANSSPYAERIKALLYRYDIGVDCAYTAEQIASIAVSDKKVRGGKINLILLKEIGEAYISPMNVEDLERFISQSYS